MLHTEPYSYVLSQARFDAATGRLGATWCCRTARDIKRYNATPSVALRMLPRDRDPEMKLLMEAAVDAGSIHDGGSAEAFGWGGSVKLSALATELFQIEFGTRWSTSVHPDNKTQM